MAGVFEVNPAVMIFAIQDHGLHKEPFIDTDLHIDVRSRSISLVTPKENKTELLNRTKGG